MIKKSKQRTSFENNNQIPIRILYKKVGQTPEVKIINLYKLKKFIVKKDLDIIPYEKQFIVCHSNKSKVYMRPNIYLPLHRVLGDLIVVGIDRKEREFKGLSQEDIIWYSKDLINKSPKNTTEHISKKKNNTFNNLYERGFEDSSNFPYNNFEKTLLGVLINLELVLASTLKNNGNKGDDNNE